MRLVQSIGSLGTVHAALDKPRTTTLCGYTITRSWHDWGKKWLRAPTYPNVGCKACRRMLGLRTPEEGKRALLRAAVQLQEVVELAIETGTLGKILRSGGSSLSVGDGGLENNGT